MLFIFSTEIRIFAFQLQKQELSITSDRSVLHVGQGHVMGLATYICNMCQILTFWKLLPFQNRFEGV